MKWVKYLWTLPVGLCAAGVPTCLVTWVPMHTVGDDFDDPHSTIQSSLADTLGFWRNCCGLFRSGMVYTAGRIDLTLSAIVGQPVKVGCFVVLMTLRDHL
jgi:hypothetical protein